MFFSGSFVLLSDSVLYPLVFVVSVLHEWVGRMVQVEGGSYGPHPRSAQGGIEFYGVQSLHSLGGLL